MTKERIHAMVEVNGIAELALEDLQGLATEFYYALWNFTERTGVSEVLNCRIDHFAIKAKDKNDYESFMAKASGLGEILSIERLNNRRIATIKLDNPLFVGELGNTYLLEVMEPRPEKVGSDNVGVDHIEAAVNPDFFDELIERLCAKGLDSEVKDNGFHKTFPFPIGGNLEFKFTDRGLANVIFLQQSTHAKV